MAMLVARGAVAALSVLVMTACSVHVRVGSQAPGPTPSTVPNLPSAIVVTDPAAPPGDFTAAQLKDALLESSDLAPGWTVATSAINQNGMPPTGCRPLDELNNWRATKVVVGFSSDGGRVQLVEGLSSQPTENAKDLLRTARSVIGQCPTITIRDNRDDPHVLSLSELSFPKLADETYAIRMGAADVFYYDTVMVRRGGVVLTAGVMTVKPGSPLLEPFTRQALAKVDDRLR